MALDIKVGFIFFSQVGPARDCAVRQANLMFWMHLIELTQIKKIKTLGESQNAC
jgi:hypothetical protein